jgi:hypothetical protein
MRGSAPVAIQFTSRSADGLGIAEETNGQGWKLIKMSAAKPQTDDWILPVCIRQRKD